MYRPLSIFIGLRNLQAKQRNHFISFIAFISILGLTLGVAVLITVMSVINGFEQQLKIKILGLIPQASVTATQPLTDWKNLSAQIQQNDTNVIASSPYIHIQGMISNNEQILSLLINGIDPQIEKQLTVLPDNMVAGSFDSLTDTSPNIILGQAFMEKMGLKLGDEVIVVLPEGSNTASGIVPRFQKFKVSGVFHISNQADRWLAYINMENARGMIKMPEGVQGIRLQLKDVFLAAQSAQKAASVRQGLTANNWTQTHGSIYESIKMERTMTTLLLLLIVLVAGFNIVSSLIMVIVDKRPEIAILKTIGATPRMIRAIFMVQGTVIGVMGTLVGTSLGVILAFYISPLSKWVNESFNLHLFDTYFVASLPSEIHISDLLLINAVAFVISLLSTIYPALKAAQVHPAQALSYE